MNYDRIIWDFNGTILDDVAVGIESADVLLTRHGLPKIETVKKYHSVFGFPIIDYYRRIGFNFDVIPYSVLAHEWVEIYLNKVVDAPIREGIDDCIRQISDLGIPQTVLSMTKQEMLIKQLDMLGITQRFDEICGLDDIYAKSKLELARKWREDHPTERVLYVGDTTHDLESAEIIGCECLLLCGGHQSVDALINSGSRVISSPEEILDEIKNGKP